RRLRGYPVVGQYGRPLRVVHRLRLHRTQKRLPALPRRRRAVLPTDCLCLQPLADHLHHRRDLHPRLLRRRLLHHARLPARHVRLLPGPRHPRPHPHRLGRRWHRRTTDRQQRGRIPSHRRCSRPRPLHGVHVHHGWPTGHRTGRQHCDAPRRRKTHHRIRPETLGVTREQLTTIH